MKQRLLSASKHNRPNPCLRTRQGVMVHVIDDIVGIVIRLIARDVQALYGVGYGRQRNNASSLWFVTTESEIISRLYGTGMWLDTRRKRPRNRVTPAVINFAQIIHRQHEQTASLAPQLRHQTAEAKRLVCSTCFRSHLSAQQVCRCEKSLLCAPSNPITNTIFS